jgi:N utilization substance protein B
VGSRRTARELALQILYQKEMSDIPLEPVLADFWKDKASPQDIRNFAETLVRGIVERMDEIDSTISKCADNWDISRMAVIDRNIIRIAAYEICYMEDIPPPVSINEAIEIAKKYGTEESGCFVNGILDKIAREKKN